MLLKKFGMYGMYDYALVNFRARATKVGAKLPSWTDDFPLQSCQYMYVL